MSSCASCRTCHRARARSAFLSPAFFRASKDPSLWRRVIVSEHDRGWCDAVVRHADRVVEVDADWSEEMLDFAEALPPIVRLEWGAASMAGDGFGRWVLPACTFAQLELQFSGGDEIAAFEHWDTARSMSAKLHVTNVDMFDDMGRMEREARARCAKLVTLGVDSARVDAWLRPDDETVFTFGDEA